MRIGINGFGRIGRCVLRQLQAYPEIQVGLINDLTSIETLSHLYNFDSVHGKAPYPSSHSSEGLVIQGKTIPVSSQPDPSKLDWAKYGVDIVFECTGKLVKGDECAVHIKQGAKKVIISAPGKKVDKTFVMGVNHLEYDPAKHNIVSNGSCTTNCLAPVAKVINDHFGIEKGLMTTIHSYTNDQRILDLPHSDLRRARAAALNMIPTSTGAAQALGEVIPELAGKLHGLAVRVPTPNVSLVDVTFVVKKSTTLEEVNKALKEASLTSLKGILAFEEKLLVSSDYNGNPSSSTVDAASTQVMDKNLVKVLSWYDNETGFSQRMVELALWISKTL
jgi:glyceraldehyde 3-phosphate dehydrogenase